MSPVGLEDRLAARERAKALARRRQPQGREQAEETNKSFKLLGAGPGDPRMPSQLTCELVRLGR